MATQRVYLCGTGDYKPGDPAPSGYIARQDWAKVQHKAGLRQRRCVNGCGKWLFPQQPCELTTVGTPAQPTAEA